MAAESDLTPTSYIQHHLQNLTASVGEGPFMTLHVDTLVSSLAMGLLITFLFWIATRRATAGVPGKWQAFVEIMLEFVDRQ
ncbi:MAG: F0F1 ATP synthase subunit A, partial [Gammaproteobacteria bacterium]|nr:F0F1 ATP synthase subunit A [Gammaproteobacteria bacterium]